MKVFTRIPDGVVLKKGDEFKCPTLGRWLPLPAKDFGRVTYNGSGAYRRPGRLSFPKPVMVADGVASGFKFPSQAEALRAIADALPSNSVVEISVTRP